MVTVILSENACRRSKERLSRFANKEHRIELLNMKINQFLKGDNFEPGEHMMYFRISTCTDNLWSCAWEGWIPACDIAEIIDEE